MPATGRFESSCDVMCLRMPSQEASFPPDAPISPRSRGERQRLRATLRHT
eukprot:CAMPEP_0198567052 /NCGR_PEP_ID=MMETSP1462-20131121/104178_1 /TAXON_ID=1333877 /ORGANISM="Brandtodinium nutriculum, Strain RCC3387" /LENGTH=49 /DNA_ID= /DNA_START= /DNA_END= /DNA_ORIENTATION=